MPESIDLIIMGAGSGSRFGSKKQFLRIGEKTLAALALEPFNKIADINNMFFVYPPDMDEKAAADAACLPARVKFIKGAEKRTGSVRNGLAMVESPYVLIHDCARPYVTIEVIERVIKGMITDRACVPAVHPVSTMKYIDDSDRLVLIPRERLYEVQTPQGYETGIIKSAYDSIKGDFTDSSSLLQEFGVRVSIVEGDPVNRKITYSQELSEGGKL